MSFLYAWVLFAILPLILLHKQHRENLKINIFETEIKSKKRQINFFYLSLLFIILALARPVLDNSYTDKKFDAQDYIIALDASFSMQADDLKPSRYEVAKSAIKHLLQEHSKDRFSTFIFTSNALLISPPTTDTSISMIALNAINPKYILTKSTSLKALLQTIAKTSHKKKKLIIFTDGGDEHKVNTLVNLCKKNNIIVYGVAVASKRGAALKQNGELIKDQYSAIVISRINPLLKDLAYISGGKYYAITSQDISLVNQLSSDISKDITEKKTIQVRSYQELFFVPLLIAIFFFFFAVTKIHQLYIFIPLVFLPQPSYAAVLDFYYLDNAQSVLKQKNYLQSIQYYEKVTPSVKTFYNIATLYYKAGHYKKALQYFTIIQTQDKFIKQNILYGLGNCAVKLKRYDRAKNYYLQALAFGEDKDALYNLKLLQKLQLKTDVNLIDMLPPKNAKTKKNSSKSTSQDKDEKKEGGSQKHSKRSAQSKNGVAGTQKKREEKQKILKKSQSKKSNYKTSYKSYELINKGFTNEKEPW
ncbi:MAG: VWA domain-containing protein [Sulfurimonas sp.]